RRPAPAGGSSSGGLSIALLCLRTVGRAIPHSRRPRPTRRHPPQRSRCRSARCRALPRSLLWLTAFTDVFFRALTRLFSASARREIRLSASFSVGGWHQGTTVT